MNFYIFHLLFAGLCLSKRSTCYLSFCLYIVVPSKRSVLLLFVIIMSFQLKYQNSNNIIVYIINNPVMARQMPGVCDTPAALQRLWMASSSLRVFFKFRKKVV